GGGSARRRSVPDARAARAVAVSAYVPHTPGDIAAMLEAIGVGSLDDLVAHVPAGLRAKAAVELPPGLTEPDLRARFAALAASNGRDDLAGFLGAGSDPPFVAPGGTPLLPRSRVRPPFP